ncbi:MAG: 7-carboxy-7-deazaguanine synthase QueE [Gammaproteobacteria bacterium]|nr:7-carboxy-7-deazaguanine synthase QueE [Gammaproteobacteria bacterium]
MSDSIVTQETGLKLRLTEIFHSLQGETRTTGIPTVFIRLTGCPLRCEYCDTSYAFTGGSWWTIPDILNEVAKYGTHYVTVTGGEPLAQKACHALLKVLCDNGYEVSLETSGAMDIAEVDPRVVKVMDLKTPGSGEVDKNRYANIDWLTASDQIKFVLCNRHDYEWAVSKLAEFHLTERCEVLFSPSYGQLALRDLAEWVLADRLPVRVQMQLHKLIWGDAPGH